MQKYLLPRKLRGYILILDTNIKVQRKPVIPIP